MLIDSVVAVGAAVRAALGPGDHGALDPRQGREGEMAYPKDEVRPFVDNDSLAYPFYHPFLKVEAECFVRQEFNAHELV